LLDACAYCDQPENRATVAEILGRREFLNCAPHDLSPALSGILDFGHGLVSGEHGRDTRFFLYAAITFAIAATLFFVQVRMRPDRDHTHH
jgi:hypothetical protein